MLLFKNSIKRYIKNKDLFCYIVCMKRTGIIFNWESQQKTRQKIKGVNRLQLIGRKNKGTSQ